MIEEFVPTDEQKHIIETSSSALIKAGPGTGKTRTAIEKARSKLLQGLTNKQQVLFLSFSNASIYRLAAAASIHFTQEEKNTLRFMTYHSCAAEILRIYGRFVGLPNKIHIMDTLEEKFVAFEQNWAHSGTNYDELVMSYGKSKGVLAFSTLIPLCIKLLQSSEQLRQAINRKYPLIIVDEFQDTSEAQWNLLKLLGQISQVVAFGDPNQIIYSSMHKATAERFEEFKRWKGIEESGFSSQNHRCGDTEILNFAESFLLGRPYTIAANSNVQEFVLNGRNQLRATLALIWRAIQNQVGPNQTIGFLTPSNKKAEEIAVALRNPPESSMVRFPVYANIVKDENAHDAILLALVAIRDFTIIGNDIACQKAAMALLTMDLTWNSKKKITIQKVNSLMTYLQECRNTDDAPLSKLMKKLIRGTDTNHFLNEFIESIEGLREFSTSCNRIKSYGHLRNKSLSIADAQLLLFDSLRSNRQPKGLEGYNAGQGKTHILNYHKAKGREFDFVVMIVDPRCESKKNPIDEHRRLYYVCATRAKKWLGIVYCKDDLGRVLGPVLKPVRTV